MVDCVHRCRREDEQGRERLYCAAMERYIPRTSCMDAVCRGDARGAREDVCDVFAPAATDAEPGGHPTGAD